MLNFCYLRKKIAKTQFREEAAVQPYHIVEQYAEMKEGRGILILLDLKLELRSYDESILYQGSTNLFQAQNKFFKYQSKIDTYS